MESLNKNSNTGKVPILIWILLVIIGGAIAIFFFLAKDKVVEPVSPANKAGIELIEQGNEKELSARKRRVALERERDSLRAVLAKKPTNKQVDEKINNSINRVYTYNEQRLDSILTNYRFTPITETGTSKGDSSRSGI